MPVKSFKTSSGRCPVSKYIEDQDPNVRKRLMDDIDQLKRNGLSLAANSDKMKKLTGYRNLYELKTRYGKLWHRILIGKIGEDLWLVEAFCKKGNVTPPQHIKNAINRIKITENIKGG